MSKTILHLILAVLVMTSTLTLPSFALSYKITDLSLQLGLTDAYDINNAGQIIGSCYAYALVYTPGKGVTNLGTGYTGGINEHGQIVGRGANSEVFLYTPGLGTVNLGTLGGKYSEAYDINETGQIVGLSEDNNGRQRAFLCTSSNDMVDLGDLGGDYSYAASINDAGVIVGRSSLGNTYGSHAFVYKQCVGMKDIDTLDNWMSTANAINNSGQIAGSFIHEVKAINADHAFIYTNGAGMIDLGTLPGRYESGAMDINDNGWVVGSSGNYDSDVHAFLYTSETGMTDLGTLGGSRSMALGINNAGQIVGWATTRNGSEHAVLWTPVPEPSSILGLFSGITGLGGIAWRRRR